ncbi:ATP-binding protein [Luteibacter aegosomaticola]|uniref:ATP-binding protein n=1 Tax=Luteibacter aegosomaticola TaxID=2911538 RepID=UPI001FF90405|nr:ATP-binding protein [Luteibacter aegosomaticola]UPG89561.1 ATP-binding protein [Luteibacter aegosomaticola]
MNSWLPRSLFRRNLVLLLSFALLAQVFFGGAFLYVQGPRAAELGRLVAIELNAIDRAFANMSPPEQRAYLQHLTGAGRLVLQEGAPPADEDPGSRFSLVAQFVNSLRDNLAPDMAFRWGGEPSPHAWVRINIGERRAWFTLPPSSLTRDRPAFFVLIAALAMMGLATLIALLIQRRINRPLREVVEAARRVGEGGDVRLPDYRASELAAVARQFNAMSDNLRAMEAVRAEMLAGISHDIRTPLTKLRLALDARERDAPEVIYIQQIDAIVGQFLDYGRAGAGEKPVDADLNTLVMQLAGEFEARDTPFQLTLAPLPALRFRPISMLRVLTNLMENAVRYAGEGLEVRTRYAEGQVHVDVLDRGPGIDAADIERLRQPFTRADAGRASVPGTGLGLAIVDRLVRLHGGTLSLAARNGGGLRASVAFPLRAAGAAEAL